MTREETEGKILQLIIDATAQVMELPEQVEPYTKYAVAHRWIHRANGEWSDFAVGMTEKILEIGGSVALIYFSSISTLLEQTLVEHDEIAEGVPFQHDGMTLRTVRVDDTA